MRSLKVSIALKIIKTFFLFLIIMFQISFQLRGKGGEMEETLPADSLELMLEYYTTQGIMTAPGEYEYLFKDLPSEVPEILKVLQGILIHIFHAHRYGIELSEERKQEVNIRKVEDMLARINEMDARPIVFARALDKRLVKNCRDYSVFMCSLLRYKGIPARARCGFGTYFIPGKYEDHWICEYWNKNENRWVMMDPQIDSIQIKAFNFDFNTLDMPAGKFVTAGETWKLCRSGELDPNLCGIFDLKGLWFVGGNVIRDLMSLNKLEVLPWDCNELMSSIKELVNLEEYTLLDKVAEITTADDSSFSEVRSFYELNSALHMPEDWEP
ncbi:MAG: transglutaminase domain-containing protein [Candidatus Stahlbacteria bacterium]|nr:MAG: transglutaminase domain-containing protein [Candidatus Stahlbacteria bacterium]